MHILPKFVSLCVVYCLTINLSHLYPQPGHILEDLNSPKLANKHFAEPNVLSIGGLFENILKLNKHQYQFADAKQPAKPVENASQPGSTAKPGSSISTTQPPASNTSTTTWPFKLKQMERYFGKQIHPKYYPFYNWYYDKLRDMVGKLKRMHYQYYYKNTLDYDSLFLRTTEFPIPDVLNFKHYLWVKEFDRMAAEEEAKNPAFFEAINNAEIDGPFNSREKFTEFEYDADDYVTISTKYRDW